tara:strand:- start:1015 stop:1269 length:255 start_codon:yes stop_codon:yes gene_type:complete
MLVNLFGRLSATDFSYINISADIKYIAFPNVAREYMNWEINFYHAALNLPAVVKQNLLNHPTFGRCNFGNYNISLNGVYDTQKK